MTRIYLAGSMFTSYERAFITELAARLRAERFEVFVPHEAFIGMSEEQRREFASLNDRDKALRVFAADYQALKWSNVLIVMVDGAQVDDGTAVEIGIFCEQMLAGQDKRAIFALSSDMRVGPQAVAGETKELNFFVAGAIHVVGEVYSSIEEIIEKLGNE
jgi:nucleoside 2-deoxyribosyltransferase